jgi:hypothetical protein
MFHELNSIDKNIAFVRDKIQTHTLNLFVKFWPIDFLIKKLN